MTQPKLTKRQRKEQRREALRARGVTPIEGAQAQPEAPSWEELKEIHDLIVQNIQNVEGIQEELRLPGVADHIDPDKLAMDVRLARTDIEKVYAPKLTELREMIKDRTGTPSDIEEIQELMEIFMEYQALADQVETNLMPIHYAIYDNVNQAVNKAKAQNEVGDVSVVTDLEAREPDTTSQPS